MARRVYVREIYFYLVCLVAIIICIIGVVSIGNNAVGYIVPATWSTRAALLPSYQQQYADLTAEEISKLVDEEIANSLRMERQMALKGLFTGVLLVIIAVPLFIVHWKKAQAMWRINIENE
jgi:hypothetical protein